MRLTAHQLNFASERVQEFASVVVAIILILVTALPAKPSTTTVTITSIDNTDGLLQGSCSLVRTQSLRIGDATTELRFVSSAGIFTTDFDPKIFATPPLYRPVTYVRNTTCSSFDFVQQPATKPGTYSKYEVAVTGQGEGALSVELSSPTTPCYVVYTSDASQEWLLIQDTRTTFVIYNDSTAAFVLTVGTESTPQSPLNDVNGLTAVFNGILEEINFICLEIEPSTLSDYVQIALSAFVAVVLVIIFALRCALGVHHHFRGARDSKTLTAGV